MGNEACDLDSATSAITYAFYLHEVSIVCSCVYMWCVCGGGQLLVDGWDIHVLNGGGGIVKICYVCLHFF